MSTFIFPITGCISQSHIEWAVPIGAFLLCEGPTFALDPAEVVVQSLETEAEGKRGRGGHGGPQQVRRLLTER
jgi:hypothetical protein